MHAPSILYRFSIYAYSYLVVNRTADTAEFESLRGYENGGIWIKI